MTRVKPKYPCGAAGKITQRALLYAFFVQSGQRYQLLAPNVHMHDYELDILAVRKSGFVDEIEIKVSRPDFLADFKKTVQLKNPEWDDALPYVDQVRKGIEKWAPVTKHDALKDGRILANYFSFMLPVHLVEQCEIPDYAGLYAYDADYFGGKVVEVKKAPRLHDRRMSPEAQAKVAFKMMWRYWYGLEGPAKRWGEDQRAYRLEKLLNAAGLCTSCGKPTDGQYPCPNADCDRYWQDSLRNAIGATT